METHGPSRPQAMEGPTAPSVDNLQGSFYVGIVALPPCPFGNRAMFDIGFSELLVILVVALIVLGPKKLPEVARSLGRGLAELRRTSEDLRRSLLIDDEIASRPRSSLRPPVSVPPAPARKETDPLKDRKTPTEPDPNEVSSIEAAAGEKGEAS